MKKQAMGKCSVVASGYFAVSCGSAPIGIIKQYSTTAHTALMASPIAYILGLNPDVLRFNE